ncbi:hypothetical protein GOODEAATRI_023332 [Goodea atripinnis]|uniref:Uncharacterized protein n=1 Tax=Goodea atripinnis TaxID=208336 RepID=A0ABV0PGB8_9TELE
MDSVNEAEAACTCGKTAELVEYCAHERLFYSHSVRREEWAAVELKTLIPSLTTLGESHWVLTKCCCPLLL